MRLISTGTLCRILPDLDRTILDRWVRQGHVRPAIDGRGRGGRHFFSLVQAMAFGVGRLLRRKGLSLHQAGLAMRWMMGQTEAELEAAFAEGRAFLLQVNDIPC